MLTAPTSLNFHILKSSSYLSVMFHLLLVADRLLRQTALTVSMPALCPLLNAPFSPWPSALASVSPLPAPFGSTHPLAPLTAYCVFVCVCQFSGFQLFISDALSVPTAGRGDGTHMPNLAPFELSIFPLPLNLSFLSHPEMYCRICLYTCRFLSFTLPLPNNLLPPPLCNWRTFRSNQIWQAKSQ